MNQHQICLPIHACAIKLSDLPKLEAHKTYLAVQYGMMKQCVHGKFGEKWVMLEGVGVQLSKTNNDACMRWTDAHMFRAGNNGMLSTTNNCVA
eukprot:1162143-Pelagomonas_calceolata.AAC.24